MLVRGRWSDLLALGRWHGPVRLLVPAARAQIQMPGHDRVATIDVDPARLQLLADQLLSWSQDIVSSAGAECADGVRDSISSSIRFLQSTAAGLSVGAKQNNGHGSEFTALQLLRALLLSRYLCDSKHMNAAVVHAVSQVYPCLAGHAESMLGPSSSKRAPSKASISRARVIFDAALLLMEHRETGRAGQIVLRHGVADSSPQKGHDWLLSCYDEIQLDMVPYHSRAWVRRPAKRESTALSLCS